MIQEFQSFFVILFLLMSHKVILIGYMGSGKSTLGEKLARELKIPFIDSDEVIEQIAKMPIHTIFEEKGEEAFRKMEAMFIQSLVNIPAFVLSTGGGMPCFHNNMELLNEIGKTIYLKNSSKGLAERLLKGKNVRPLIQGKSEAQLIQFIDENLLIREKFYSQAAITLELKDQGLLEVLKIVKELKD